jgi:curved DNA-binding protein CbpA
LSIARMAKDAEDPYQVLGVTQAVTPRELRRAYRRRIVRSHRVFVLELVENLEALKRAHDTLRDPAKRKALDERLDSAKDANARSRREALLRERLNADLNHHASRLGAEATRTNAATVNALADEHEALELREERRQLRRSTFDRRLRAVFTLLVFVGSAITLTLLARR